jgi:hypothetical protein
MHFPTPADREFVLNTYHADEGGWEILSRLADHLDSMVFIMRVGENDNAPRFEVRITVTLIENGQAQTELTLDILVLSANDAARTNLAGARIGWSQTLDRLAMMLESSSGRGK